MTKVEGAYVVLRMHYGKRGSNNPVISSTMGRTAVINHAYIGPMPQVDTCWLCRVDREIFHSKEKGCFVVTPVKQIASDRVVRLVPGVYHLEIQNQNVILRPKIEGHYWIAPSSIKKLYLREGRAEILYQSVIVPVQPEAELPVPEGYETEVTGEPEDAEA
jgi:hypothetical protein